jgi:hypothetical protein
VTGFRAARWAGLALAAWELDFAAMYAWVTFGCPAAGARLGQAAGAAGALAALVGRWAGTSPGSSLSCP